MSSLSSDLSDSLSKNNIFPNKKLGQCFLVSKKALEQIIKASKIKKGEKILEIGPGTGILTRELLNRGAKVVAVEKDKRLFEIIRDNFQKEIKEARLTLIKGDFLNLNFPRFLKDLNFKEKEYKVVSNLPYQITSPVLKVLLEENFLPKDIIITIQKEVAMRICAGKGELGSLSVMVQSCSKGCNIVNKFPPSYFKPQPEVDSALIKIEGLDYPKGIDINFLRNLLRIGFSSKRKKLAKNFKNVFPKEQIDIIWEELNIPENVRAEDLVVEKWGEIARKIKTWSTN